MATRSRPISPPQAASLRPTSPVSGFDEKEEEPTIYLIAKTSENTKYVNIDEYDAMFADNSDPKSKNFRALEPFKINRKYVKGSELIADTKAEYIPLPQVSKEVLLEIMKYMRHHAGDKPAIIQRPIRSRFMVDNVKDPFDASFIDTIGDNMKSLYELYFAASYMNFESLVFLCAAKIASLVKSQPLDKIDAILSFKEDEVKEGKGERKAKEKPKTPPKPEGKAEEKPKTPPKPEGKAEEKPKTPPKPEGKAEEKPKTREKKSSAGWEEKFQEDDTDYDEEKENGSSKSTTKSKRSRYPKSPLKSPAKPPSGRTSPPKVESPVSPVSPPHKKPRAKGSR